MATVFKIGEDSDMPPPPPGFPKCGNYNGKGLVSYLYPEDVGLLSYPSINESDSNTLDSDNGSRVDMISTLGKWWPFVGGAHAYVSSTASVGQPLCSSFILCIVICIFLNKLYIINL